MTDKDLEKLLILFSGNPVLTYKDIELVFLDHTKHVIDCCLLGIDGKDPIVGLRVSDLIESGNPPKPMYQSGIWIQGRLDSGYRFSSSDQFHLTSHGENLLYRLQKEHRNYKLARHTFIATCAGIAIGLIGLVLGWLSLHKTP